MIKYDTGNFTEEIINFLDFQDSIPKEDLEDYFNFTKDEYINASMMRLKASLITCVCIWRTFYKFELRDATDPYAEIKKVDFNKFYVDMQQYIRDNSDSKEVTDMMKANFSYVVKAARDKMRIGVLIERFALEEKAKIRVDSTHIPDDIVSPGLYLKDFLLVLQCQNPTAELRKRLEDGDSYGLQTRLQIEKKQSPKWYESNIKLKLFCEKIEYCFMHDLITAKQGEDIILIQKGVSFEPKNINENKEIYQEAEIVGEEPGEDFSRDFSAKENDSPADVI